MIYHSNDNCAYVRRRVISSLREFDSNDVISTLMAGLKDEDLGVQERAIASLANFIGNRVLQELFSVALKPNKHVSWRAFNTLMLMGEPAIKYLKGMLSNHDPAIRYRATKTLGMIPTKKSKRLVRKMLNDPEEEVRIRAKLSLRKLDFL